jgi:alkylated DNA repair protein (DNA oxidative demethylase)
VDDLVVKKSFLTFPEQRELYEQVLHIEPGFYVPVLRNGHRMNLRMNCLGHHWSSVTYKYSRLRDVDRRPAAPVPDFLQEVARRALVQTNYWHGPGAVPPYDICIMNLYEERGGKLGIHADNSESPASLARGYPVVSLSVGATAVFTIGGLTRQEPQDVYHLESGDVVLFGRSRRLAYHGVSKIVRCTTPPELGFRTPGRLNLTFRIL